ncbi:hypothetical protein ShzoTeo12_53700 (plasmid) [Shinella zoogloeoides]|nr:hypothetical protein ShzoTeo12_53700 [Shinella zoogloeoides]
MNPKQDAERRGPLWPAHITRRPSFGGSGRPPPPSAKRTCSAWVRRMQLIITRGERRRRRAPDVSGGGVEPAASRMRRHSTRSPRSARQRNARQGAACGFCRLKAGGGGRASGSVTQPTLGRRTRRKRTAISSPRGIGQRNVSETHWQLLPFSPGWHRTMPALPLVAEDDGAENDNFIPTRDLCRDRPHERSTHPFDTVAGRGKTSCAATDEHAPCGIRANGTGEDSGFRQSRLRLSNARR